ncbi:MAG: flagellar protein FliS, partial [Candidatus Cloacimonetes bacterium]|nr:flagellar protein FliS [Candidatus Cloacimonadota bacterium]
MSNRFQTYKQVNVNTMNRGKIVVMLFSGAITFLSKAKMFADKKDYYQKGKFIN